MQFLPQEQSILLLTQLGTVLSKKENSTIYTDETRKYGKTLEAYLVTDS